MASTPARTEQAEVAVVAQREMERWPVPGMAIGVLHDGEVESWGFGVTSIETKQPVTADTLFQIGSISKVFTTTLIMRLVDEGRFGLDDPASAIQQARELAVADAEAKATELARLANATLGPIQVISEGYAPSSPAVPYDGAGMAYDEAVRSSAPTINPGQTEVVLTVYVTYAIS